MTDRIVDPVLDESIPIVEVPYVSARELIEQARMLERSALRTLVRAAPRAFMAEFDHGSVSADRHSARSLRRWAARIVDEIEDSREWEATRPRLYLSIELHHRWDDEVVASTGPVEV
jgi:hypothetical protein